MIRVLLMVAIVVLVVAMLRSLGRGSRLFDIRVTGRGFAHRGSVPGWAWSDVLEFLRSQKLPPGCTIRGVPEDDRFRLEFSGPIDEGTRQKIRNFMYLKS